MLEQPFLSRFLEREMVFEFRSGHGSFSWAKRPPLGQMEKVRVMCGLPFCKVL